MPAGRAPERVSELALIPVAATGLFYVLSPHLRAMPAVQFLPQVLGYLALAIWVLRNRNVVDRLGLRYRHVGEGARWGMPTGLALGLLNVSVILWLFPWLGYDISFLRNTPHARVPVLLMVPWFILGIAIAVEVNFRGFLLGRLLALAARVSPFNQLRAGQALAVATSAVVFSFDPFMVATFKHLHWIAVWDGLVWGMIWLRIRNLYATILAHAVEVVVMYSILRIVLS